MAHEGAVVRKTGKRGKQSRRVRLEDLAQHCGVSVSTVSRALDGGKGVNKDLRARIVDAAKELNYAIPASVAGRQVILAANSGAMIDDIRNQFTFRVLDGLRARASMLGVEIVTRAVGGPQDMAGVLTDANSQAAVVGSLFLSLDDEATLTQVNPGKPVVLVNGEDPSMRLSSVTPCNRAAARIATEHLLTLGHRRILFLMHCGRRTIERRREGWQDAMQAVGISGLQDLAIDVGDWLPDLAAAAIDTRVASRGLDFTAVLAASDSLAVGATMGLLRLGFRIPEDVSVMGMDDVPQAAFFNPPLTTVHIPMREIGVAALDLLLEDLGGFSMPPRRVELACQIVVRQTTGVVR